MKPTLIEYFDEERRRVLEGCTVCGLCARKCPIVPHTPLKEITPQDIQQRIKTFLKTGQPDNIVFTRAFACMECFKCVLDDCPQGLNPLHIHELVRQDYRRRGLHDFAYTDPRDPDAIQRVAASIQISADEYQKILTPAGRDRAKYVFFPGCNVYFQPEKVLTALDLMNVITEDYAFVPGLDNCCGNVYLYAGDLEQAQQASMTLLERLASYQPETVIFWCPTCHSRMHTTYSHTTTLPFEVISFPQFLARHADSLPFKKSLSKTVTLHEACKSAFTGADVNGTRDLLRKLPGIELIDMPRHGKDTVCCGSGAIDLFPESFAAVRDDRLQEAANMQADALVDVCHYCHDVMARQAAYYDYDLVNYITLIAQALGIAREDTFQKYLRWGDPQAILADAEPYIASSPYSRELITAVVKKIF